MSDDLTTRLLELHIQLIQSARETGTCLADAWNKNVLALELHALLLALQLQVPLVPFTIAFLQDRVLLHVIFNTRSLSLSTCTVRGQTALGGVHGGVARHLNSPEPPPISPANCACLAAYFVGMSTFIWSAWNTGDEFVASKHFDIITTVMVKILEKALHSSSSTHQNYRGFDIGNPK